MKVYGTMYIMNRGGCYTLYISLLRYPYHTIPNTISNRLSKITVCVEKYYSIIEISVDSFAPWERFLGILIFCRCGSTYRLDEPIIVKY